MSSSSNPSSQNPLNTAVQTLISTVSGLVGNLSPFAKAVVPAATGLVGSLATMAISGHFDWPSIEVLGVGVVTAVAVYVIPNLEKKSTPVAPVAPATPVAPTAQKPAA